MLIYFRVVCELLGVEDQADTIVACADDKLALLADRRRQNRPMVTLVCTNEGACSCIPGFQCLVGRCRDDDVPFRGGQTDEGSDGVLHSRLINKTHHIRLQPGLPRVLASRGGALCLGPKCMPSRPLLR